MRFLRKTSLQDWLCLSPSFISCQYIEKKKSILTILRDVNKWNIVHFLYVNQKLADPLWINIEPIRTTLYCKRNDELWTKQTNIKGWKLLFELSLDTMVFVFVFGANCIMRYLKNTCRKELSLPLDQLVFRLAQLWKRKKISKKKKYPIQFDTKEKLKVIK